MFSWPKIWETSAIWYPLASMSDAAMWRSSCTAVWAGRGSRAEWSEARFVRVARKRLTVVALEEPSAECVARAEMGAECLGDICGQEDRTSTAALRAGHATTSLGGRRADQEDAAGEVKIVQLQGA